MFRIGDNVKVIDDNQEGVVTKIHQNKITVLNQYGFEEIFHPSELILREDLIINDFEVPAKSEQKNTNSVPHADEIREIDLHIGQLVDVTADLTNFEMLSIQLSKVKTEIETARLERRNRLIFIHGHGSGKLKEELHKLLSSYAKLEFYDASFRKYKLGATEVKLF